MRSRRPDRSGAVIRRYTYYTYRVKEPLKPELVTLPSDQELQAD